MFALCFGVFSVVGLLRFLTCFRAFLKLSSALTLNELSGARCCEFSLFGKIDIWVFQIKRFSTLKLKMRHYGKPLVE